MISSNEDNTQALELPNRVTLISYPIVTSTNSIARNLAVQGAEDWTVVQGLEQNAGRGRHGKSWISPPGNLYISIVLRPDISLEVWPQLSFVVAVAVAEMVESLAPSKCVRLKWPNDVMVGGAKISGILLETMLDPDQKPAVIVGVGINIAHFPDIKNYEATSLRDVIGRKIDLDWFLCSFLHIIVKWHDIWTSKGFSPIRDAWRSRAFGLNREVHVVRDKYQSINGTFKGISDEGQIIIDLGDGKVEFFSAGVVNFFQGAGR